MANTPFLDLVKPAGTDHALVSVINSNSDKIDGGVSTLSEQIATYDMGSISSIANLQTAITTYANGSAMVNNQSKNFVFTPTFTDDYFIGNSNYFGTVVRITQNRFSVIFQNHGSSKYVIRAVDANGTWYWDKLALDSEKIGYNITKVWTGDVFTAPAGLYRCPSTAPNLPVTSNGYLTVIVRSDGLKFIQFITDSNRVFTNTQNNGNWAGWNELATEPKANIVNVALSGATTYTFATATPFLLLITRSGTTLTGSFGFYIGFAGAQASALKEVVAPTAGIDNVSINNLVLTVTGSAAGQSMTIIYL